MTFRNTAIKNNMTLTKLQLKKVIPGELVLYRVLQNKPISDLAMFWFRLDCLVYFPSRKRFWICSKDLWN